MSSGGPACPYETSGISVFRFGLYQAVVRRSIRGTFLKGIGLEIFSQIIAKRKFAGQLLTSCGKESCRRLSSVTG
jgi:hypothetical protein